MPFFFYIRKSI